jgi:hypothetical protein
VCFFGSHPPTFDPLEHRVAAIIKGRGAPALRAVGGQVGAQVGDFGVAVLGNQADDAVDAPALAGATGERERGSGDVGHTNASHP